MPDHNSLLKAANALGRSKGLQALGQLKKLTPEQVKAIMGTINGSLLTIIKGMLATNFAARGISNPTLLKFVSEIEFDVNAVRVRVKMPSGVEFPAGPRGGKGGNPYAAISLLGLWQLTEAQQKEIFAIKSQLLEVEMLKYGLESK